MNEKNECEHTIRGKILPSCEVCFPELINDKETKKILNYAGQAQILGLGDISMQVWKSCCDNYGVGGTPKALRAYGNIMQEVFKNLT